MEKTLIFHSGALKKTTNAGKYLFLGIPGMGRLNSVKTPDLHPRNYEILGGWDFLKWMC